MPTLVELIRERFPDFTEVQKQAMPKVLAGDHVLILAPTGSGKTESALLPVLEKIDQQKGGIQALYITPLRALGRDMLSRFNWWCEQLDITHSIRHGDSTVSERAKHREKPPHILIITVETLQALFLGRVMRKHLANVRYVILDEVHDIMDNKRGVQLSLALERLELLAPGFQRIALSATVARPEEAARMAFGQRSYALVETGRGRNMDIAVEYHPQQTERLKRAVELVQTEKTLLFVNTRSTAEELGAGLKNAGVQLEIHHGSLAKEVRIGAEEKFKRNETRVLLATSSMELGLDIGDVDQVVQYGSPHQVFRLVQRVGRSGHTLQGIPKGTVLTTDWDDRYEAEALKAFATQGWLEPKRMEQGASDVIAHQLIGLALDQGGRVELKQAHALFARSGAYGIGFHQLRRIALQLYGEGLIFYDEGSGGENDVSIKTRQMAREYYYTYLSTIPKEKRYPMKDVIGNRILASLDERFVVNLEPGVSFLARGTAWKVLEVGDEILVEPSEATEILIPEWVGEDIPVTYEIAYNAARLRSEQKNAPDPEAITLEIVDELVVAHVAFGSRVNEGMGRVLAYRLSERLGEPCQMVSDAYRVMLRLPYKLDERHLLEQWTKLHDIRSELEQSLQGSAMLRFKFIHVARLFGLLHPDATVGQRFIDAMKNSIVYQETLRSIFFRYFDVERTQEILGKVQKKEIRLLVDKRAEPSAFARIGLDRLGGGREAVGVFEPRKQIVAAFKEKLLEKTLELECLNCHATRLLWLANAPEEIVCHVCKKKELTIVERIPRRGQQGGGSGNRETERGDGKRAGIDPKAGKRRGTTAAEGAETPQQYARNLIRNYGKRALLALATYGVGAATAERVLRKLQPDEETFYWDLIEAQKNFIKNKKYWKLE